MQNDAGEVVELYVPRKWYCFFHFFYFHTFFSSSSGRIIAANDHASVQIDFVDVDPETGRMIPGKVCILPSAAYRNPQNGFLP